MCAQCRSGNYWRYLQTYWKKSRHGDLLYGVCLISTRVWDHRLTFITTSVLIGPALSPILGGIFTEYTSQTWRSAQYFLAGCGALSVVLTFFFLPETFHPPTVHERLKKERGKKFVMYWVNPFRSVMLLRWPNIAMAVSRSFFPFQ